MAKIKHGHKTKTFTTIEYKAWKRMKAKCYNQKHQAYKYYGGQGISVCERWRNSFENFLKDMGFRSPSKTSIGRIDNKGNYEPSNCRWENRKEQANNTNRNTHITLNEETHTIAEWADIIGIKASTIYARRGNGWTDEECLRKTLFLHRANPTP